VDPAIDSALQWFRRIYLDGIPVLLRDRETAFLSFLCVVAAIDALAGYRYTATGDGDRFKLFVTDYFPREYAPHAPKLWLFRCRMLHNFSPAHFSLVHAQPGAHLQRSAIGDITLDDASFFDHLVHAAEKYFGELQHSHARQAGMLARLQNPNHGGQIHVA
jgi:hypothetical protein